MVVTLPTPGPDNVGWVIEDYDELSSDLSVVVEIETSREEEPRLDPRASTAYGPSRTIIRRHSLDSLVDEIELDGPLTFHHVQHPTGAITRLIGSVGGKPWIIARLPDTRDQNPASATPTRSKDMTEYTDEELAQAIYIAAYDRMDSIDINHDISQETHQIHISVLNDLRAILEHLPVKGEPAEEWEPCTFGDIRKGDRVRRVQSGRTTDFHSPVIEAHASHLIFQGGMQCGKLHNALYYRIPAPIVTPDPAEHPTIIVREIAYTLGNTSGKVYEQALWNHGDSDTGRYNTSAGRELRPERIIDWKPANMIEVADDR